MDLRIVYFGSDDFSYEIFAKLTTFKGVEIVGVVTTPDTTTKIRGGNVIKRSPFSEVVNPILKPKNLEDPEFHEQLRKMDANLFVVVSYKILPESVWKMPEFGTINVHPSLLPRHRGAAPIEWTLLSGDRMCGVTTFLIDNTLDQGKIIIQSVLEEVQGDAGDYLRIDPNELTYRGLRHLLLGKSVHVLYRTIDMIRRSGNNLPEVIPTHGLPSSYAKKITSEVTRVDWTDDPDNILRHFRALQMSPDNLGKSRVWTTFNGKRIVDLHVRLELEEDYDTVLEAGQVVKEGVHIMIGLGGTKYRLRLLCLQPEGKRQPMDADAWWNGLQDKSNVKFV